MSATICRIRPLQRKVSYTDEMSSGELAALVGGFRFFQNSIAARLYPVLKNYSGESYSNSSLRTSRAQSKPVPGARQEDTDTWAVLGGLGGSRRFYAAWEDLGGLGRSRRPGLVWDLGRVVSFFLQMKTDEACWCEGGKVT
ncbi:unnamed protein product [Prunus armeniaca]